MLESSSLFLSSAKFPESSLSRSSIELLCSPSIIIYLILNNISHAVQNPCIHCISSILHKIVPIYFYENVYIWIFLLKTNKFYAYLCIGITEILLANGFFLKYFSHMFIPALGAGVLLLGIYIAILHLFVNEPPVLRSDAVFHIGCYDPQNTNNHSLELGQKLARMQQQALGDIKFNMYHSTALAPDFEQEVQQLAIAFEDYINNYYKFKVRSERDLQYYNSLQLAKRDYELCSKDQLLDADACLNDWKNYQTSIDSFNSLKKELGDLIDDKEAQQRRISAVILEYTEEDDSEIQKKYTTKIIELRQKLAQEEDQIVDLKTKKGKIWKEIDAEQSNLQDIKNLLNECVTNKELINFCKKISDELFKFKESVPKKDKNTMEHRITQKRKIIDGLELNVRKLQKYGTKQEVEKAENELKIQKRQLTLLEVEVTNFQTTEQSKCAMCSQEKIAQLRKNITILTEHIAKMRQAHADYTNQLDDVEKALHETKGDISNAQQARETQINTKFCVDDKCKQEQKENLFRLERALNELKKQIVDKQIQINFITNNQKKKLESMDKYLPDIQQATTCLLKKDFYEQLKTKAPQKTDFNQKMIGCKDKVLKELQDFEL